MNLGLTILDLLTSILVIIILWKQLETIRKHNHLSVKPNFNITVKTYKEQKHSTPHVIFFIKNVGLGPALITSHPIFVNGEVVKEDDFKKKQFWLDNFKITCGDAHATIKHLVRAGLLPGESLCLIDVFCTVKVENTKSISDCFKFSVGYETEAEDGKQNYDASKDDFIDIST